MKLCVLGWDCPKKSLHFLKNFIHFMVVHLIFDSVPPVDLCLWDQHLLVEEGVSIFQALSCAVAVDATEVVLYDLVDDFALRLGPVV